MKTVIFCSLALLFSFDSLLRTFKSNFNLGVILMYMITVSLWTYGIFNKQIDKFCSHGFGFWLKVIFLSGCGFLCFMLIFIFVASLSNPPKNDEKSIVVLGAGLRGEVVSGVLRRRLDAAYDYHLKNPDAIIVVTGGQGPGENIPEAVAMKKYLVSRGVPSDLIIEESKSTSTEENLLFAKELLTLHGISAEEPTAVVTNTFHSYRANQYAKKCGFSSARSISCTTGWASVMPCYLREVFAVLYLWVFKK